MKILRIIFTLLTILGLAGCQATPASINRNGVKKAQNAGEAQISSQMIDESISDNSINEQITSIFANLPEMVVKTVGTHKEIQYNAVVNIPKRLPSNLYTYKLTNKKITDEMCKKIVDVYFGAKANEVINDEEGHVYRLGNEKALNSECFTLLKDSANIYLSGRMKNLCPFQSNIYNMDTDLNLRYSQQDAIALCENFSKNIGLINYALDYSHAYGRTMGEPYYSVSLCMYQDGLPVVSKSKNTKLNFSVVDEGIYTIDGYLFNLEKIDAVSNLISLDAAMNILESEINKVTIHYDKDSVLSEYLDEDGNFAAFPISSISFEYIDRVNENKEHIVSPAWRFTIGDKDKLVDRSKILAVDAITGEVIF